MQPIDVTCSYGTVHLRQRQIFTVISLGIVKISKFIKHGAFDKAVGLETFDKEGLHLFLDCRVCDLKLDLKNVRLTTWILPGLFCMIHPNLQNAWFLR